MTQSNENATAQQPAQPQPLGLMAALGMAIRNERLASIFRIVERVNEETYVAQSFSPETGRAGELLFLDLYDLKNNAQLYNDEQAFAHAVNSQCVKEGRSPLFVEQPAESAA